MGDTQEHSGSAEDRPIPVAPASASVPASAPASVPAHTQAAGPGPRTNASPTAKRGLGHKILMVLGWLAAILGAVLLGSSIWVLNTFGQISFQQMVANIPGLGGNGEGGGADPDVIKSFVIEAVLIPLALVAGAALIYFALTHTLSGRHPRTFLVSHRRGIAGLASIALFLAGTSAASSSMGIPAYIRGIVTDASISNYYKEPVITSTPDDPKNLVVIYLESMDADFGSPEYMGEDLLSDLHSSTTGWASLPNLTMSPYYGYTMGGVVTTQCGIPPKPAEGMIMTEAAPQANNNIGDGLATYMPGATCLGDVLQEAGYHNVYMGGAPESFASKGTFLSSHGFDTVLGYEHWRAQGETQFSGWGLSDQRLFENAKEEVRELHKSDEPFTLSMITLDNHAPITDFGYCPDTTGNLEKNTVRCQSHIVSDFIDDMDTNGILDDTVVVVMADHQAFTTADIASYKRDMGWRAQQQLPLFNAVWSPDGAAFARESGTQAHMYPTMLQLLGFGLQDHQAGMGVSLLVPESDVADSHTILNLGFDDLANLYNSSSTDLYKKLWD